MQRWRASCSVLCSVGTGCDQLGIMACCNLWGLLAPLHSLGGSLHLGSLTGDRQGLLCTDVLVSIGLMWMAMQCQGTCSGYHIWYWDLTIAEKGRYRSRVVPVVFFSLSWEKKIWTPSFALAGLNHASDPNSTHCEQETWYANLTLVNSTALGIQSSRSMEDKGRIL
jgi:hypothetical protein